MPDFNRIKHHKDGRISISGFPSITVATWKRNEKGGWDIEPTSRELKREAVNVSPRSLADDKIIEWAKRMGAWRSAEIEGA